MDITSERVVAVSTNYIGCGTDTVHVAIDVSFSRQRNETVISWKFWFVI